MSMMQYDKWQCSTAFYRFTIPHLWYNSSLNCSYEMSVHYCLQHPLYGLREGISWWLLVMYQTKTKFQNKNKISVQCHV